MNFKLVAVFGVLLVALVSGAEDSKSKKAKKVQGKIVGGEAIDISAIPYQVSILLKGSGHFCGGSVIGSRTILTAAHCLRTQKTKDLSIRTGSAKSNEGGVVNKVAKFVIHPKYKHQGYDHDLAIIYTEDLIKDAMAINIATEDPADGEISLVSGYGLEHSRFTKASPYLRYVYMPIVNRRLCLASYLLVNTVTKSMICAGGLLSENDACQGDSGGPLVIGNKLTGVVSWGLGCGKMYGVFASVPAHHEWIKSMVI